MKTFHAITIIKYHHNTLVGVQITSGKKSMSRVSVYEVSNPLVGTWTLTIPSGCGTHTYYVKSTSDTNIAFKHDFMQPLPGPIANVPDSQPLIGKTEY